jgi:hypothetical protein
MWMVVREKGRWKTLAPILLANGKLLAIGQSPDPKFQARNSLGETVYHVYHDQLVAYIHYIVILSLM